MLGWFVEVHRQTDGGGKPATSSSPLGTKLFTWAAGSSGTDWLDEHVRAGNAVDLGGGGYPCRYSAKAGAVFDHMEVDQPEKTNWTYKEGDFPRGPWGSKAYMNREGVAACSRDEWVIVDFWDES